MRCLTIQQPWASLIALGIKPTENRASGTDYRGPLALHVSQAYDGDASRRYPVRRALGRADDPAVPRELFAGTWGQVIAVVDLVDVHLAVDGCCAPWGEATRPAVRDIEPPRPARHWTLINPRAITPVPARGALGLWDLDDTLLPAEVVA